MKPDLAPVRQRRQLAAAVGLRQRAFLAGLYGGVKARWLQPVPVDRVLRRTVVGIMVQRFTVHAWRVLPVLSQRHTVVERLLRSGGHVGPMAVPPHHGPSSQAHWHETRLREHLLRSTQTLLARYGAVVPLARAFRQGSPTWVPGQAAAPTAWPLAQAVPRLNTTLLSTRGPGDAATASRVQTGTDRDAQGPRPIPLAAAAIAPMVLPAQEMSRVTEHVLQQLDRRFLSYRERTGRV